MADSSLLTSFISQWKPDENIINIDIVIDNARTHKARKQKTNGKIATSQSMPAIKICRWESLPGCAANKQNASSPASFPRRRIMNRSSSLQVVDCRSSQIYTSQFKTRCQENRQGGDESKQNARWRSIPKQEIFGATLKGLNVNGQRCVSGSSQESNKCRAKWESVVLGRNDSPCLSSNLNASWSCNSSHRKKPDLNRAAAMLNASWGSPSSSFSAKVLPSAKLCVAADHMKNTNISMFASSSSVYQNAIMSSVANQSRLDADMKPRKPLRVENEE